MLPLYVLFSLALVGWLSDFRLRGYVLDVHSMTKKIPSLSVAEWAAVIQAAAAVAALIVQVLKP